jgi:Tol biopolymer transport system component
VTDEPFPYNTKLHVRDLQTGQTESMPAFDQLDANTQRWWKHHPVLSSDGRYLGFAAYHRNFRTGVEGHALYVMDRQTGSLEPVLKKTDGTAELVGLTGAFARVTDRENPSLSMSDDGQTIAFASTSKLVPEDTDSSSDVYVVNRVTGARKLVSRTSSGQQVPDQSSSASLSRDGRYVAFTSDTSLTGAPISTHGYDGQRPYVHRYDLATDRIDNVSMDRGGKVAVGWSPQISGDGRFVTFSSHGPGLLPEWMSVWPYWIGQSTDAFLWDSANRQIELVSINDGGDHSGIAQALRPAVSDDGQYVAFHNSATLVEGQTTWNQAQVTARDRSAGTTRLLSINKWDVSGYGTSLAPVMSGDGSRVAFLSTAADLVEDDTNNLRDVFLYDRTRGGDEPAAGSGEAGGGSCPGDGGDSEGYSDLSIDAAEIQPTALEQGQRGQVEVTVRNGGGIPSEATTVRLYDGEPGQGTLIGEQALTELAAGGDAKLTFTWDPTGSAGEHTLTAVVDPARLVFEQNVANNEAGEAVDVVAPRLDLTVSPDKPAYDANETVKLAARAANGSIAERDVRLAVSIRDEDGEQVSDVHDGQVRIGANGEATVDAEWGTLDTTPGTYTVSARLLNAVGDELASDESSFAIEPDVEAGVALETDELSYGPDDTARIAAIVTNRSANAPLSGAHVALSLRDPDGELVEDWDLSAGEVGQGRASRLGQERTLGDLDPGTYDLSAKLLAADGTQLAEAMTDFAVRSSADTGDSVRGTLTASPPDPYRFTTAAFSYSLTNSGNADIEGATVRVRISDLAGGDTLKTLDEQREITRAGPNSGSLSTRADMAENRDYQASLHLVLADGTERPLDRAIFRVRPVPFTHGASFDTAPRNRVLVWACESGDEAAALDALGDTFASYVVGCGAEEQQRFMRLVRGGDHNQFWILGKHHPIERGMGDELGARVIQGDGLLVASAKPGHDLNLGGNLSPFGAAHAGSVPPGTYTLQFAAASAFAGLDAQVGGAPAKLTTTQGTGIATTSWGATSNRKTAISATYNQFGRGKAILIGAAPSEFAERSRASAVLAEAARVLLPASDVTRAAGLARLELFVEGVAPGSPVEMRTQLPAGAGVPQPPSDATLAGDLLTLPFDAEGTQRKERAVWLKLPAGAPSATTSSQVFYDDAGEMKPYGDPATATLDIAETEQSARDAALTAIGQIGGADPAKLQKIRDDVNAAGADTRDTGVLFARLRALLDDIGTLERAKWTNTGVAWSAVARLVAYVEHDYYLAGGK